MSTCKGHSNIIWLNLGVLCFVTLKVVLPLIGLRLNACIANNILSYECSFCKEIDCYSGATNPPQLVVWVWISNLISAKKKDTLHAQNYVFPQWTSSCSNLTPHRCSVCCLDNWGPLCVSVSLCLCACVYVLLSTLLTSCSWHCSRCGPYPLNWTPLTF